MAGTGVKQAQRAGNGGVVPPVEHRFQKGDKRINRRGRPKDFDALRALVRDFLAEPTTKNKSRLWKLLEDMARTKGERVKMLEYGYGKVPDKVETVGSMNLQVEGLEKVLEKVYGNRDDPG
jgi:hypothetical protein